MHELFSWKILWWISCVNFLEEQYQRQDLKPLFPYLSLDLSLFFQSRWVSNPNPISSFLVESMVELSPNPFFSCGFGCRSFRSRGIEELLWFWGFLAWVLALVGIFLYLETKASAIYKLHGMHVCYLWFPHQILIWFNVWSISPTF